MSGAPGQAAREAAIVMVHGVIQHQRSLTELVADGSGPVQALSPGERARAGALAAGVLRHVARLDTLIGRFVKRPPSGPALSALRLAAFEILVDDVPPHAAVDAAVELVKASKGSGHLSGLVNAVARRIATEGGALWQSLPPSGPGPWLGPRLKAAYGKQALRAISRAHETGAPIDLTPKDPAGADALAAAVSGEVLPTGTVRLRSGGQVSGLSGYDEGAFWVQDAAAALPARLLGDVTGQAVLDLCAAPGGKTMQLAAAGANVTALDRSAPRLERVHENLQRTGLVAQVIAADALDWQAPEAYDAILLDAPCSATGTLRRHPDQPFLRPEPDLAPVRALQADLIDAALSWLAPGGKLVFCTCSLLPEEGELQVAAALERHPDLARLDHPAIAGLDAAWNTPDGDLRLRPDYWPEAGGMDGFFASLLGRKG